MFTEILHFWRGICWIVTINNSFTFYCKVLGNMRCHLWRPVIPDPNPGSSQTYSWIHVLCCESLTFSAGMTSEIPIEAASFASHYYRAGHFSLIKCKCSNSNFRKIHLFFCSMIGAKIWGHDLQWTPSFDTVTELASCPLIFAGDVQQNTIQIDLQANRRPSFIIRNAGASASGIYKLGKNQLG